MIIFYYTDYAKFDVNHKIIKKKSKHTAFNYFVFRFEHGFEYEYEFSTTVHVHEVDSFVMKGRVSI